MALSFDQTQNGEEAIVVTVPTDDVPDSVIDQLNNEVGRAPSDFDGNDEGMVDFLDEEYKKSISNEIRERRREKKKETSKTLSQSYKASSEGIRSASCVLSKQPKILHDQSHVIIEEDQHDDCGTGVKATVYRHLHIHLRQIKL
jgi:hypothetical protein